MLALPEMPKDTLKLADWLELRAVLAGDRNSSAGDLDSALRTGSVYDRDDRAALERAITDVFDELRFRSVAAGRGYPFELTGTKLQLTAKGSKRTAYLFCLCVSYLSVLAPKRAKIHPTRVFEELCTEVARRFVGGDAVRFGSPRHKAALPADFAKALDEVCQLHLREGDGFAEQPAAAFKDVKDFGLDIVAWRDHPDRLPGKLVFLGACAAGHDWNGKLTELNPSAFCAQWMKRSPLVAPLKGFFVPHRVRRDAWEKTSRLAGLVFDRCRIAALVPTLPANTAHGDAERWMTERFQAARVA